MCKAGNIHYYFKISQCFGNLLQERTLVAANQQPISRFFYCSLHLFFHNFLFGFGQTKARKNFHLNVFLLPLIQYVSNFRSQIFTYANQQLIQIHQSISKDIFPNVVQHQQWQVIFLQKLPMEFRHDYLTRAVPRRNQPERVLA